jgi:hypothetical protein
MLGIEKTWKAMARKAVSLETLFAIIDREFTRARPPQCKRCITPLPFRKAKPDEVSANWSIVEPAECPHDCRVLFAEVVTRLMSELELESRASGDR